MICNQHVCLREYSKCQLRFGSLNCEFINKIHVHNDTYSLDLIILKNPMLSIYNNNKKMFSDDFSVFK